MKILEFFGLKKIEIPNDFHCECGNCDSENLYLSITQLDELAHIEIWDNRYTTDFRYLYLKQKTLRLLIKRLRKVDKQITEHLLKTQH